MEGHRRILEALGLRDGNGAAQALREELGRAKDHLLRHVLPNEPASDIDGSWHEMALAVHE
jgi:DNA-binding GntR family transcriptional regulator